MCMWHQFQRTRAVALVVDTYTILTTTYNMAIFGSALRLNTIVNNGGNISRGGVDSEDQTFAQKEVS